MDTHEKTLHDAAVDLVASHRTATEAEANLRQARAVCDTADKRVRAQSEALAKCVGRNISRRVFLVGATTVTVEYRDDVNGVVQPAKITIDDVIGG